MKTQIATSITGDLTKATWKFQLQDGFKMSAGQFAILPKENYDKLLVALRGITNSMMAHPDYQPNSEFADIVARCDEILNKL